MSLSAVGAVALVSRVEANSLQTAAVKAQPGATARDTWACLQRQDLQTVSTARTTPRGRLLSLKFAVAEKGSVKAVVAVVVNDLVVDVVVVAECEARVGVGEEAHGGESVGESGDESGYQRETCQKPVLTGARL